MPSPSDAAPDAGPPRVVIVGNPGSRRVGGFQEALGRMGLPAATVVSYAGWIAGRESLEGAIGAGTVLRIESPDQDFEVERALIAAGADVEDEHGEGPTRIGRAAALRLDFDLGRLRYPRQWFLGFREVLRRIDRQRSQCPPHAVMNPPAEIVIMFDKPRCHALFTEHGVPCARGLGTPRGYDDLRARMAAAGIGRAFVKLAHGSSASGVVALETDGHRQQAFTTVEAVRRDGELRLYNSRAIRRMESARAIGEVVDALCRERAHAEQWVPKAGLGDSSFDLRVVVIAGRAAHVVVRLSQTPMTNLHLKNRRGDLDALRARMPAGAWSAVLHTCEAAAGVVPESLYAGVDLVVAPGYRRLAVLEINAFGDLLPGIACEGRDTYTAEAVAALGAGGSDAR